jgi:hypothetical protein
MVVEERTKSKPTSQHTKEEIRGLENFLILRLGITSTEVSSILRHYGVVTIAMLQQAVYEEGLATFGNATAVQSAKGGGGIDHQRAQAAQTV